MNTSRQEVRPGCENHRIATRQRIFLDRRRVGVAVASRNPRYCKRNEHKRNPLRPLHRESIHVHTSPESHSLRGVQARARIVDREFAIRSIESVSSP